MPERVSIVVPCYNEAENVPLLAEKISDVVEGLSADYIYECIFVNDGSSDGTRAEIDALTASGMPVVGVHFVRNFGQSAALVAGGRGGRTGCGERPGGSGGRGGDPPRSSWVNPWIPRRSHGGGRCGHGWVCPWVGRCIRSGGLCSLAYSASGFFSPSASHPDISRYREQGDRWCSSGTAA